MRTMRTIGAGLALVAMTSPGWAASSGNPVTDTINAATNVDVVVADYAEISAPSDITVNITPTTTGATGSGSGTATVNSNSAVTVKLTAGSMSLPKSTGGAPAVLAAATASVNYDWNAQIQYNATTADLGLLNDGTHTELFTSTSNDGTINNVGAGASSIGLAVKVRTYDGYTIAAGTKNNAAVLTLTVSRATASP